MCLVGNFSSRAIVHRDKDIGAVCRQSICYLIMCDDQNNQYTRALFWSLLRIVVTQAIDEIDNSLRGSTRRPSQNESSKLSAIRFLYWRTLALRSFSITHAMPLSKPTSNNTILSKPHRRHKSNRSSSFSKKFRQTGAPISQSSNKTALFSKFSTIPNNGRPRP